MRQRVLIPILLGLLVVSSCSGGPDLSESERIQAEDAVLVASRRAGIELADSDRRCVVDKTSTLQAQELIDLLVEDSLVLNDPMAESIADNVVDCVGADLLVRSGLLGFTSGISEESLTCTGKTFDKVLLAELIASYMAQRDGNRTEIEIEIGLVLGVCLSPDELLVLHQS